MFAIDYKSRVPLYQQIVENVEKLTLRGILLPEQQLPSVRALAMELSINPNTIAKAYAELEARGLIYSLPGRGSF
ncbi:MAG: GntR family transcriptional regulator, partial [Bacillota bacterium]|nr:GntR family transcriptional regulator [Bacillota bacterium]